MRRVLALLGTVLAIAVSGAWLYSIGQAQVREQRSAIRFTMVDALKHLNVFTGAYIEHVASKEKDGSFILDRSGARILQSRLAEIYKVFESVDDQQAVVARLTPETRVQVLMALKCEGCGPGWPSARLDKVTDSARDLRLVLRERLSELMKLLDTERPERSFSKDEVLLIERHIFYLRHITIAYI